MKALSIFFVVFAVLMAGCNVQDKIGSQDNKTNDSNNRFAFDLYSKINKDSDNVFFSPFSISSAMAMTYEGARGKTAEEIRSVFHFPEIAVMRSSFKSFNQWINRENKSYRLSNANALWAQKDYPFTDEYASTAREYYDANISNVDFKAELEESRLKINSWVESKTNSKIKDLIPQGAVSSDTRLVVTNAIYFKGTWIKQFEKENTREDIFTYDWLPPDSGLKRPVHGMKVQMMEMTKESFNYSETADFQVLELPYSGGDLSMILVLPKSGKELDWDSYSDLRKSLREQEVNVFIPRFKMETKYFMSKTLSEMGMPAAFSDSADFSGMDGNGGLIIHDVIHQAFVEVNEEGTEAAAATGVVVGITSVGKEPPVFRADHPFTFIIQERSNGNILFMGRFSKP